MPVTTPEAYRQKRTKSVTLESGFTFRIRKLPIEVMSKFLDLIGVKVSANMSKQAVEAQIDKMVKAPEFKEKLFEAMTIVIPAGVAEPRIVITNAAPEGCLSLNEVATLDQFDLFLEIVEFQGLAEEVEKFRKKLDRRTRRESSADTA